MAKNKRMWIIASIITGLIVAFAAGRLTAPGPEVKADVSYDWVMAVLDAAWRSTWDEMPTPTRTDNETFACWRVSAFDLLLEDGEHVQAWRCEDAQGVVNWEWKPGPSPLPSGTP